MCYLINTCVYVFCKQIQINFSYHQVISLIHRNICQKESYMSKRVMQPWWKFGCTHVGKYHLLPCRFLYLNFKTLQTKLDVDKIIFSLKTTEGNSIIFSVGIINISYLKAPSWSQGLNELFNIDLWKNRVLNTTGVCGSCDSLPCRRSRDDPCWGTRKIWFFAAQKSLTGLLFIQFSCKI